VYHGYRLLNGERNSAFRQATDGRLLNFKEGDLAAIDAEADELGAVLNCLRLPPRVLVAVIPGHRAVVTNRNTTLSQLVDVLTAQDGRLVASVDTLVRRQDVEKLAVGGSRSVKVHVESIRVQEPPSLHAETVVVLDDVVSTGHSMEAARELLGHAGAARVACVAIARTAKLIG
jgi:predicted amidophosphoribosyltransferase